MTVVSPTQLAGEQGKNEVNNKISINRLTKRKKMIKLEVEVEGIR